MMPEGWRGTFLRPAAGLTRRGAVASVWLIRGGLGRGRSRSLSGATAATLVSGAPACSSRTNREGLPRLERTTTA
jgi:hypothetical protein